MHPSLPPNFPAEKKKELEKIVGVIQKNAEVEMIILYGSYAKGDFVLEDKSEERATLFRSDFDLLIITKNKKTEEKFEAWELTEKEIMHNENILTKPQFVVSNIERANRKLKRGRYFYKDIYESGILLYDSGRHKLSTPVEFRELPPTEQLQQAEEYLESWMKKADMCIEGYVIFLKRGETDKDFLAKAAFELHQAAERLFHCTELVFAAYRPPIHNLLELKKRSQQYLPTLEHFFFDEKRPCLCGQQRTSTVFKSQKGLEHICTNCNPGAKTFVTLARAYVDAQYGKHYRITSAELEQMHEKVLELKILVEQACAEEVERLRGKVK